MTINADMKMSEHCRSAASQGNQIIGIIGIYIIQGLIITMDVCLYISLYVSIHIYYMYVLRLSVCTYVYLPVGLSVSMHCIQ